MGARAEFVFVREKDDAGMQGDWALVTMRAGSDSAMVLALPDPPSDLEAPRMSGRKLDAGVGGAGFLGIGHLSAAALLCSRGGGGPGVVADGVGEEGGGKACCARQGATAATQGVPRLAVVHLSLHGLRRGAQRARVTR